MVNAFVFFHFVTVILMSTMVGIKLIVKLCCFGGELFPILCNIKIIQIVIYCYHYMAMKSAVLHQTKCVLFHFDFFMNLSLKLLHFCWLNRGATDKYLGIPMQFKQENVLETRLGINYAYRGRIWS